MTLDEARKVALICCQADNGCSACVGALTQKLREAFPEFRWEYDGNAPRTLKIPYTLGEAISEEDYNYSSYEPILVYEARNPHPKLPVRE